MGKVNNMEEVAVNSLRPYERNAKLHPRDQIEKLKRSIEEFGFLSPCLIDRDGNIIAGHGRVEAAKELGLETVPCVYVEGLTDEQRRAYIIADNRLTELGGWDEDIVQNELAELAASGFDIDITGFKLEDEQPDAIPEEAGEYNPTLLLPESRVMLFTVSAFGTSSEIILGAKLPQSAADHLLEVSSKEKGSDIIEKLIGGIYGL